MKVMVFQPVAQTDAALFFKASRPKNDHAITVAATDTAGENVPQLYGKLLWAQSRKKRDFFCKQAPKSVIGKSLPAGLFQPCLYNGRICQLPQSNLQENRFLHLPARVRLNAAAALHRDGNTLRKSYPADDLIFCGRFLRAVEQIAQHLPAAEDSAKQLPLPQLLIIEPKWPGSFCQPPGNTFLLHIGHDLRTHDAPVGLLQNKHIIVARRM